MPIPDFNHCFSSYQGISEMLKNYNYTDIISQVSSMVNIDIGALSNYPMGGYSKGKGSGVYQYVLHDLIKNISRYDEVYQMLSDDISKKIFTLLIQFRLIPDLQFIRTAYDKNYPQYFDKTIVNCTENEVFVDCGGFTGDTTEEFIRQYKNYKHIYVYEPSDDNIKTCQSNLHKYPNITIRNCGVGEKNEVLPISNSKSSSSFLGNINGQGDSNIQIISLDEDIKEKVTYIKMDIEGFEIPGLIGAKNHIKNDTPKLAICTYHILSDIWEIPLLIHSINPNYNYYFRHYMPDQNWETVLYAIPKDTIKNNQTEKKPQTIVAFPWREGWTNTELTKDCGLIPYLLHKNHNLKAIMVGAAKEQYPYLTTYVNGLHMEFLKTGSVYEKNEYIVQHGKDIDAILLRGAYDTNIDLAINYKKINPNGKIYMGLDANSHWMDRILWDNEYFIKMLNNCDVIATSCKALQKHLNEKWPWKIEYIPNGYYNFNEDRPVPSFDKKENIILTVSRLGTPQKATPILLEAFASIADKIPDWKLRLVGSIENNFKKYIDNFFQKYPHLTSQIEFTGVISDKNKLLEEYLRAKIFTLTSTFEGAPNVVAEALIGGCVMAVTKFDAWEDAIDEGRCGMAAEINDISGIASMYLELCQTANLKQLSENSYQYALRTYDMEYIVAKLYEMLFGGDSFECN